MMDNTATTVTAPQVQPKPTKMNTAGYTILSFFDNDIRQMLKDELSTINIGNEHVDTVTNKILIKLNDDPQIIMNFLGNKAANIKDTKQTIRDINKTTRKSQLVKKARTPKEKSIPPVDLTDENYLNALKGDDIKQILTELSKNRTDTNKHVSKKEMIRQIIMITTENKKTTIDTDTNDDDANDEKDNDHKIGDEHDDDDDNDIEYYDNDDEEPLKPVETIPEKHRKEFKKALATPNEKVFVPKKVTKKT